MNATTPKSALDALLDQAHPRSRFWIQDGIANGDLDEAADDFAALNNPGGGALANAILECLGQEPIFFIR